MALFHGPVHKIKQQLHAWDTGKKSVLLLHYRNLSFYDTLSCKLMLKTNLLLT